MSLSRRSFLLGVSSLLAGCATSQVPPPMLSYAAVPDEQFPLAAMPLDVFPAELHRKEVAYPTKLKPGSVVVDTPARRLYFILDDGRAIRYAISVGRAGLALSGGATVGRKAKWPTWTPTANMMRREARYKAYAGGLPGGPTNPLGARAMYLYRQGRDTMFRIHGTNQPKSIGHAMSSGCIRMLNHDVIDLYDRVDVGTQVVVIQAEPVA
ncbi:L,D-transpeptidase [Tianweitania sp. BSSL-BM11]|uniref:L,D-transpeptidase n=1 Tax=Tianweitania aestuarii TaxID=2814886 RepID=A0ABS5S0K6_9HYPH|nr:L,D-transpeptidase [Tianweitania aestuarii]MBS9722600.1 L,D-transpeptidase [Tianweitania aestuarii]